MDEDQKKMKREYTAKLIHFFEKEFSMHWFSAMEFVTMYPSLAFRIYLRYFPEQRSRDFINQFNQHEITRTKSQKRKFQR